MKKHRDVKDHRDSAKESIRNAAAELFAAKGYAATSTREICQRAGITKPVLYYHFGNKERLYEQLVLDAFDEYKGSLSRAVRRGGTPREKLVEVLSAMFAYARDKHNYWRLGFRMVMAPEKDSPEFNFVEMSQEDERLLAEIVREGVRRRDFKGKPDFVAGAIVGMAISTILGFLLTGEPPLDRTIARKMIDLLCQGCCRNSTHR